MARSSECTDYYAQKVLDDAGIVRDAWLQHLQRRRRCQWDMELIFVTLEHTFLVSACALVCSRECRSCFDDSVSNRMARARLLHHCGGVAHQTSLRSRSIMMCYANSPPCGEAGSLFS